MSSQPFKFRHLDAIVGAFVLSSVGIVLLAIVLIGASRQWFASRTTVDASTEVADAGRGEFLEEMAENLRPGTPVELAGEVVGAVAAAQAKDGFLRLRLSIADRTLAALHADAKAVIKVPLAPFMGQPKVVLKAGSDGFTGWLDEQGRPRRDLPIAPPRDSTAMAMAVLKDLEGNLAPMMQSVTALLVESRALVGEVREQRIPQQAGAFIAAVNERQVPQRLDALLARVESIAASADAAAADARRITAGLAEGKGVAGRALNDQRLADDLVALAADLRAIGGELRKASPAAPALAEGAGTLLDEVKRLVDGLNRHWLLRSYTDPGDGERLVPSGLVEPLEATP